MSGTPKRVTICRSISFSAGHRYFNPKWSEADNAAKYGSQHSPAGFGHNFVLEAYLDGEVDAATGMVVNLKEVDEWLREVTDPLDHAFLNNDIPWFQDRVPTAENVALFCFQHLQERVVRAGHMHLRIVKVRLYEGRDLWVDCDVEEK